MAKNHVSTKILEGEILSPNSLSCSEDTFIVTGSGEIFDFGPNDVLKGTPPEGTTFHFTNGTTYTVEKGDIILGRAVDYPFSYPMTSELDTLYDRS